MYYCPYVLFIHHIVGNDTVSSIQIYTGVFVFGIHFWLIRICSYSLALSSTYESHIHRYIDRVISNRIKRHLKFIIIIIHLDIRIAPLDDRLTECVPYLRPMLKPDDENACPK